MKWSQIKTPQDAAQYNARMGFFFFSSGAMDFFSTTIKSEYGLREDDNSYYLVIRDINPNEVELFSVVRLTMGGRIKFVNGMTMLTNESECAEKFASLGKLV
jgi:hypothetical protein